MTKSDNSMVGTLTSSVNMTMRYSMRVLVVIVMIAAGFLGSILVAMHYSSASASSSPIMLFIGYGALLLGFAIYIWRVISGPIDVPLTRVVLRRTKADYVGYILNHMIRQTAALRVEIYRETLFDEQALRSLQQIAAWITASPVNRYLALLQKKTPEDEDSLLDLIERAVNLSQHFADQILEELKKASPVDSKAKDADILRSNLHNLFFDKCARFEGELERMVGESRHLAEKFRDVGIVFVPPRLMEVTEDNILFDNYCQQSGLALTADPIDPIHLCILSRFLYILAVSRFLPETLFNEAQVVYAYQLLEQFERAITKKTKSDGPTRMVSIYCQNIKKRRDELRQLLVCPPMISGEAA